MKYTTLPPQLVILRALKAGHYLLVAVCAIGLSGHLLTVSLGALFQTNITHISSDSLFKASLLPQINQTIPHIFDGGSGIGYSEHFCVEETNITSRTPLPPWVSSDYIFLPVDMENVSRLGDAQLFKVTTQGFGVDVRCTQLNIPGSNITVTIDLSTAKTNTLSSLDKVALLNVQDNDGRNFGCVSRSLGAITNLSRANQSIESAAQIEDVLIPLSQNATVDQATFCSSTSLIGFLRTNGSDRPPNSSPRKESQGITGVYAEALWLGCRPTLQVAEFEVSIDPRGYVLNSTRTGEFATDISSFFVGSMNATALYAQTNDLITASSIALSTTARFWHNDTFADTWPPYLIKLCSNSTDLLSGSSPLPLAASMAPIIEDLHTRLFAIIPGLNTDIFTPAPLGTTTLGTTIVSCTRIIMSEAMYIIATTLLSLNILVAVAYYVRRPRRLLPYMPITIASVLELFQGSGLLSEATSA